MVAAAPSYSGATGPHSPGRRGPRRHSRPGRRGASTGNLLVTCRYVPLTRSILPVNGHYALPQVAAPTKPLVRPTIAAGLAAAAVSLAYAALSAPLPATAVVWGGAALAVWCLALLTGCAIVAGRDGLGLAQWKPGSWFLAYCAVADGLSSMSRSGILPLILPSSVVRAEWLTAAALTAWAVGYCADLRRPGVALVTRFLRHRIGRGSARTCGPLTPWLLYAAGTAARLAGVVLLGNLGYVSIHPGAASAAWYQQALSDAALACPLAVLTAGLRAFRERAPGAKATLAVLLAAEIVSALVMGTKDQVITAIVAVAIARASAGLGVPVRAVLATAALCLLFVIPFTAAYRAEVRSTTPGGTISSLSPAQAAAAAPTIASASASAVSLGTLGTSLSYLGQRLSDISGPALVIQETPSQIPYASPAQIPETLAASLVPRVLWPGKPLGDPGLEFTREYYGSDILTASAITPQGDLYRYGGWVTVVAGMAALGWLVRNLDDALDVRTPQAALALLLLWPVLASPEDSYTGMLAVLPGLILTWIVVTAAAFRVGNPGTPGLVVAKRASMPRRNSEDS